MAAHESGANGAGSDTERDALEAVCRRAFTALRDARNAPSTVLAQLRAELGRVQGSQVLRALDTRDVLRQWTEEGPLVHETTGFATLDDATGGGPVYGTRWYLLGAPDAGKTALIVQWAHVLAELGVCVGLLAIDEEASDLVTRLAQRVGFERRACEARESGAIARMAELLGDLPIRFYGPGWSIERAAADLGAYATERGARAALFVDSIQTAKCEAVIATNRELSETQQIGLNVEALRAVSQQHQLITLATSEMSRGAYSAIKKHDRTNPMAAGKWSGAIEYSARVLLSAQECEDDPDVLEVEIPKNKHGRRRRRDRGEAIYLRIDLARQVVTECAKPAPRADAEGESKGEARAAAQAAKVDAMGERVITELVKRIARGIDITNVAGLREIVRGDKNIISAAITRLVADGRIEGGRGKPYRPRLGSDEEKVPDVPDVPESCLSGTPDLPDRVCMPALRSRQAGTSRTQSPPETVDRDDEQHACDEKPPRPASVADVAETPVASEIPDPPPVADLARVCAECGGDLVLTTVFRGGAARLGCARCRKLVPLEARGARGAA
jgi:hypothetical protein